MLIPKPVRAADPTFEPVTRGEAKEQLRIAVSNTEHDAFIDRLIKSARLQFEADTNIVCCTGSFTVKYQHWPSGSYLELPFRNVTSVTSIVSTDTAGSPQTFSSSSWSLDNNRPVSTIILGYGQSWPTHRGHLNDITVTLVAGYTTQGAIPEDIKQAILLRIQSEFERDDEKVQVAVNRASERLTARYARQTYP